MSDVAVRTCNHPQIYVGDGLITTQLGGECLICQRDALRAERDELRAKMEVAEAGYAAAVRQAQWQSITNSELNAAAKSVDALRAELAEVEFKSHEECVRYEAELADVRGALAIALNTDGDHSQTCPCKICRQTAELDSIKSGTLFVDQAAIIRNLRSELAALREAKEADFECYHDIYMVLLNSRRDQNLITGVELAKTLVAERDALREAAGNVPCAECNDTGLVFEFTPYERPCPCCAALRKILGKKP
jgi:hypothetical protein